MGSDDTAVEAHYQTRCQFLYHGRVSTEILLFFLAGMADIALRDAYFSLISIAYGLHQKQLFSIFFSTQLQR